MTWIVGAVPPFGYSILVSDIRVSWSDGSEKDCLQKIYKVGNDFLCGFAGSVKIGFNMLDFLAIQLPAKQHRSPPVLAESWIPALARRVFASAPKAEQALGCQIILAAAHPTKVLGDAPDPRTYVWTFTWPDFIPKQATFKAPLGIGSGSVVPAYESAMMETCNDVSFLRLITHGVQTQAQCLARTMHESVSKTATKGVSPFMQVGILTRGEAVIGNYNYRRFEAEGKETEVRVPNVIQSYRAFREYCRTGTPNSSGAVC